MAKKKVNKAGPVSARRAEQFRSTGQRSTKRPSSKVKKDTRKIAGGTVKLGKAGKYYNKFNASTGRWERVTSGPKVTTQKRRQGQSSSAANQWSDSQRKAVMRNYYATPGKVVGEPVAGGTTAGTAAIKILGWLGRTGSKAAKTPLKPSPVRPALRGGPKAIGPGRRAVGPRTPGGRGGRAITAGTPNQRAAAGIRRGTRREAARYTASNAAAGGRAGYGPIPMPGAGQVVKGRVVSPRAAEASSARSAAAKKGWETRRRNASTPRRKK